ncbi:MAG TPA: hypothetical protein PK887_02770 [Ignavibacteriales bacterium]|nr:hypothetical protein [Ignavibacteriales bacterium]
MKRITIFLAVIISLSAQQFQQKKIIPEQSNKKSVGLAVIYSLILPGMGELYAGNYSSGKYFTIAEGCIWGTYLGLNSYSRYISSNYKGFAKSYANIGNSKTDDDFWSNIGKYNTVYDYNNEKLRLRQFNQVYNTDEKYWNWQDVDSRLRYRSNWKSSEIVKSNARLVLTTLALNRFISAINAARTAVSYNKNQISENYYFGVTINEAPDFSNSLNFNILLELK